MSSPAGRTSSRPRWRTSRPPGCWPSSTARWPSRAPRRPTRPAAADARTEARARKNREGRTAAAQYTDAVMGELTPALIDAPPLVLTRLETPLGDMVAVTDDAALHLLEFHDRTALASEMRRIE